MTEPDPGTLTHLASLPGPIVAWIGPLAARSGSDTMLGVYDVLVTFHEPDVSLVIAGPADPAHSAALQRCTERLNLTRAWIAPDATDAEIAAMRIGCHVVLGPEHTPAGTDRVGLAVVLAELLSDLPHVAAQAAAASDPVPPAP